MLDKFIEILKFNETLNVDSLTIVGIIENLSLLHIVPFFTSFCDTRLLTRTFTIFNL